LNKGLRAFFRAGFVVAAARAGDLVVAFDELTKSIDQSGKFVVL